MPEQTTHPSQAALAAYNLGQLPPEEAAAIENHIAECERCCETIVGMSSDDTFVALLQEARQLPTDQTLDGDGSTAKPPSSLPDVPAPLAEHARYEIVGLIGRGGMGDVYKARHRLMKRTVALKIINREFVRRAEAVERFHREVEAAAKLSHPNVVTAHDAEQAGDVHFLAMEYVDGVNLSQTIQDRGPLPIAEACDYIRQAAIGLQYAHEQGMVHRDIKPHNLMLTADGTVKILDFGLASLTQVATTDAEGVVPDSTLTAVGAIMGTPDFISPEQANDARQADIRSDIYSLGATLYFLLSGRPPFAEGSVMHKLKSHAQAEPEPLESLRDDVPPELVAVVTKMTAKDPEERYLTPSEVAHALESFLRTWRPDEAEARGKEPSSGGNMSGSGGQKPGATDLSPDWLSALAKWLFYISLLPIAVLVLDVFVLSDEASTAAADRVLYYLLASVCLSSVAGVLTGIHQSKTGSRDDHRIFRLTAGQTLLIAAILTGAAVYFFNSANNGGVRVEVTPPEDRTTLGTHPLTIVDTSGRKPLGGTSGTRQDDAVGVTIHFFESANGRYKIELSNEVLTVNGDNYTLENPTDSIRIVDDRVEITRVEVRSKDGKPIDAQPLSRADKTQQILDRMVKAYAECKSYSDSGVIEAVVRERPDSPNVPMDYSFTTSFLRPDRFRFEIKDQDENRLLISASAENVRTWWDIEPGIQEPESLELAFAQALGFTGGNVGHIPALLMPDKLEVWSSLHIVDPKLREDDVLGDVECFRLEFNFSNEKTILWIDKHTYLVRRIEHVLKSDGIYAEWTTTYNPTIDVEITDKMLEFDPPSLPGADDNVDVSGQTRAEDQQSRHIESVSR